MSAASRVSALGRRTHAALLAASGATGRRLAAQSGIVTLMYHRVLADDEPPGSVHPGMYVRASSLRRQMLWLRERFPVYTLGEMLDRDDHGPAAVVTFDDGWRDNLEIAWPILCEFGVRPTIFVVSDWCRSGRTAHGSFLLPAEIAELSRAGVEFGAHTATHPRLDEATQEQTILEMCRSKAAVEEWTGRACRVFAYPYGRYRAATLDAARELFGGSVVVGGGWWRRGTDPAAIPRVAIHDDVSATDSLFAARLAFAGERRGPARGVAVQPHRARHA